MSRIIDLTLTLHQGMRGVEFETTKTVERDGWNARILHLYSHAGTHMDAPAHFDAGPQTIDQISLDRCMGPAWIVNLDGIEARKLIDRALVASLENSLQPNDSLLLRTGWSRHVDDLSHYRDNLPRVAEDLARWCVERKVKLLGVEPPSVADVNNREELTHIHKILLGGGVILVEGLANLNQVQTQKVFFAALPLKIDSGDGCPCRAFAIESGGLL